VTRYKDEYAKVAAFFGHLDLLIFLIEKGCPLSDNVCLGACGGGRVNV